MPLGSPLSSSAGSPPPGQPAAPPSRQEIERKLSVHSISIQDSPHQRTRMQRKGSLPLPMPSSPTHQGPSSFFPPAALSGTSASTSSSSSSPPSVPRSLSLQSPSSPPSSRLPPLSISSPPIDPSSASASSSISSPSSALPPNNHPSATQQLNSNLPTSTSQNLAAISETAGMRTFSDSENDLDYEGEDEEDEDEDEEGGEEGEEDGEMRRKVEGERVLKSGYLEKKGEKRKNWKKRWFVLRTEKLSYYKDDREYKLLRLIDLHDIHSVALVQLKKYSSAICLVTQARTYYVKARTTNDAESWVEAIKLAKKDLKESDEAKINSPPQGGAGALAGGGGGGGGGTPMPSRRLGGSASSAGGGPSFPSSTSAGPPSNRSVSPSHSASSTGGGVGLFNPSSPFLSSSSQSSAPNSPPSPLRINPNQPEWSISPTTVVSPTNITNSSPIDLRPPTSPTRGGNASSSEDEDFDEAPTPAPQVISTDPNKVILSGYLMKMGKRKNWRKRWFVLTSGSLVYCSSHMDTKPHRIIPLSRILDALEYEPATKESSLSNPLRSLSDNSNSADPSSSLGTPVKAMGPSSSMGGGLGGGGGGDKSKQHVEHSLKIVTAKKAFILCAPSEEEEIKWLSAIQALVARRTKGSQPATAKPQPQVQIPPLPHSSSSSTIRASSQPTSPTLQSNIPTIHEQPPSPPAVPPSTVPGSNVILGGPVPRSRTPSPSRQPTPQTHSQYLPSIESQISSSENFPAATRSGSESETGGDGGASSSSAKEKEKVAAAAAPVVRRERSDTTAGKEAVENVRRLYHPEEPQL